MKKLAVVVLWILLAEGLVRLNLSVDGALIPSYSIHNVLDRKTETEKILPLAGVSNVNTYLCRENEGVIQFTSDRYGFNNPTEAWKDPDLILIGDSFIQGHCVKKEDQLAELYRASGKKVLNLGMRGTGPISQLGVFLEYAKPFPEKKIQWFILANDLLYDLPRETVEPVLLDYLNSKTQNLRSKQSEANLLLKSLGANEPVHITGLQFPKLISEWFFHWLRPQPHREILEGNPFNEISESRWNLFVEPYLQAQKFHPDIEFVFIPDSWFFSEKYADRLQKIHNQLIGHFAKNGLSVKSPLHEMQKLENPLRLYAALDGYYGHFNREGFRWFFNQLDRKDKL